jgi:hypothetical protein
MDWRTFFVELARAVAWPATTLIIVCWLRGPLAELIRLLRKVKYRDVELEFDKADRLGTVVLKEKISASSPQTMRDARVSDSVKEILKTSPESALIIAWKELEMSMRTAANRLPSATAIEPGNLSLYDILNKFTNTGKITAAQAELFQSLWHLRNLVAHGLTDKVVTDEDAQKYAQLAATLKQVFDELK